MEMPCVRHALLLVCAFVLLTPRTGAQSPTSLDGIAMIREMQMDPIAMSMELRYDTFVLFRGGVAIRGIPAGAPTSWNADSLSLAAPQVAGRWSESGGALRIVMSRGTERVFKDWFRMTPGRPDERPDGVWMRAAFMAQPSGAGRSTTASAVRQLALHADGRFEGTLSGGASTGTDAGGVVAAQQRASGGRYRIDGFEIEFRYDDGRVVRELFCYSSDGYGTLLIGRARMTKRK